MTEKKCGSPQLVKYSSDFKNRPSDKEETYTIEEAITRVGFGAFQRRLILLTGITWAADAFEIIILSLIGQILACHWVIYRWQNALLTSGVFGGMILGCPLFGVIADKYGRRTSIAVSLGILFASGSLSAAAPSYAWMLAFRIVTGFSLGGVAQGLTLCSEYVPAKQRGRAGFYLCYFWSLGTIGVVLVAWLVMKFNGSWRLLLAITALPSFPVLAALKWFPESPRYNIVSNRFDRAVKVINDMAAMNRKQLPPGQLRPGVACESRGRFFDLFIPEYRRSTLLFWYMCVASALCYYGIALMTPIIIQKGNIESLRKGNENSSSFFQDFTERQPCVELTQENYIDLLWTSAAEFPGLIIFTILVELCDRRKLMCGSCIISSALVFMLLIPTEKNILPLLLLFGARAIILSLFQLTYIMTSEAFPTTLRAVAMGTGSGFCRLGGILSPYISQILLISNPTAAVMVLGSFILLAGIAAAFLPIETRARELTESHISKEQK